MEYSPGASSGVAEKIIAGGSGHQRDVFGGRLEPAAAVESGERDAAPVNIYGANGFAIHVHAHHHCGILFDFADLIERDVVGEAGHQRGPKAQRAEIAGGEARDHEKYRAADYQRANRDENGSERDGAMQAIGRGAFGIERRSGGARGAAADFESDECGNGNQEENAEGNQECGVHGENCRREHARDGEHGHE